MSRAFVLLFSAAAMTVAVPSAQAPATPRSGGHGAMLTVDSIMRGPRLVGYPPRDVRWAADSSKLYFTWQRPEDVRPGTWTVDRNGAGLRRLTEEKAPDISNAVAQRASDRA